MGFAFGGLEGGCLSSLVGSISRAKQSPIERMVRKN